MTQQTPTKEQIKAFLNDFFPDVSFTEFEEKRIAKILAPLIDLYTED